MIPPYTSHNPYLLPSLQITNTYGEMASYTENLYLMLYISLFVITEIAFIVGSVTHVFIIAVNVIDWRRGRTMSVSDQVIISIMISRMILQSVIQLNLFSKLFCVMCSYIYQVVFQFIYLSNMYCSFWMSTLLCVVFYLKICNYNSVYFLWLRRFFFKRILHFIMASLLVSIGQTTVIALVHVPPNIHNVSLNSTHMTKPLQTVSVVFVVNMFGPLLIYLLSSLFLIISLYLHIRHMRCSRTVTSSLDAYYRIIKYTTGSIFTSLLCVIISVLPKKYQTMFDFVFFSFPWNTFGTLHSMLLIYATPKLKTPFSRILKYLSNCWTKREET